VLQKYTGLPSCSSTCGDAAVTVIPQTGSLSWVDVPVVGAAAFGEQQLAAADGVESAGAALLAHPHPPPGAAALTGAASGPLAWPQQDLPADGAGSGCE